MKKAIKLVLILSITILIPIITSFKASWRAKPAITETKPKLAIIDVTFTPFIFPTTPSLANSAPIWEAVLEYLESATNFYKCDSDLQSFTFSIYLGASPNSNKQAVIDNWKIYRNQDIVIDDSIYNEEYEF